MSVFDDQMVQMFQTMVLPTMKQMPTPQLKQIQDYLNEQIGEELARRQQEGEPAPPTPDDLAAELQRRGMVTGANPGTQALKDSVYSDDSEPSDMPGFRD